MARHTPLYDAHIASHGRMVDFAGWEMPVQYTGVIEEHRAVRSAAGLFDVSHMGEIEITGAGAFDFVQRMTTNDVALMTDGRAQYSILLNERGTVIDDVIVYRHGPEHFMLVVNASNAAKDFAWLQQNAPTNATLRDVSDTYALIAFQGPRAAEILQSLSKADIASIKTYWFARGDVAGCKDMIIARTGYTGEDGFELFCAPAEAMRVWNALLDAGKGIGVMPAGLGARDTLRMEMKYSLYGHEITDQTNPFEAGLSWVVKMNKASDFMGKKALTAIKERGPTRALVGFKMIDRAIPRDGYAIVHEGTPVGTVTSGTMSPSLNEPIGIGYVPISLGAIGSTFWIDIRGKQKQAHVVATPFYKK